MNQTLSFLILLMILGCNSNSSDADFQNKSTSVSDANKVSINGDKVVCKNLYYKFKEVGSKKSAVLIQVEEIEEMFRSKDSTESFVQISAYEPSDNPFNKKLWSKSFHVDDVQFDPRYLHLVRNPRGVNEDLSIFVDYFTGEELISFTGPNAFFAIPNQEEKRIVGFLSRANDLDLLKTEGKDIVGNLTYASATNKLQTIHFRMKNQSLENSIQRFTPGMMIETAGEEDKVLDDGRTVLLGSLRDGFIAEKISNIDIQLIFYLSEVQKEISVTIPIIKDKMDITKATYDKNIFVLEN